MSPENIKILLEKYPKLFARTQENSPYSIALFGPECQDGWFHIIDTLCRRIQGHIDNNKKEFQPVIAQIKEKFGTLRFYCDYTNEYIDGLISMAESISANTCERCGNPGKLRGYGWLYTACDKHANDEDKNNETDT